MQSQPIALPSDVTALRLRSWVASAAVVIVACLAYRYAPFDFHRRQFGELYGMGSFRFTGEQFLYSAAGVYIAALLLFHLVEPEGKPSKALRLLYVLPAFARQPGSVWRKGLNSEDRLAALATLLKAFFAPMMVMGLLMFSNDALNHGRALLAAPESFSSGLLTSASVHWFLLRTILFVDVLIFTFGYLVELPSLGNRIRSVDPTLYGWMAALACYPPFNLATGFLLGSTVSDFPQFDDPVAHAALNWLLLGLMAIYASASVALGWKGSNLTHRGIVGRGPYAFVRHPAYVAKNAAWWVGSLPLIGAGFHESWLAGCAALLSMFSWSALYVLRALTEEDHLRKVDGEYAAYAAKVPYRFIPGVV